MKEEEFMITFFIALALLIVGYFVYGKFIEHVFHPDERATPCVAHPDGVDFCPITKWRAFLIQLLNIAGLGPIFGALSGAIMLAGFQKSTANLDGEKSKGVTYQTAKELVQKFEEKAGAVSCKDIKGIETGKMLHSCPDCIKDAAALVEEVLHL